MGFPLPKAESRNKNANRNFKKGPEVQVFTDGHKRTEVNQKTGETKIFWKDMLVTPETHSRPRVGKTARDAANGAKRRNFENKQSRVSWQHDQKATTFNFPYNSCNGKRNRTVVTAKGNERRVIGRAKSATK